MKRSTGEDVIRGGQRGWQYRGDERAASDDHGDEAIDDCLGDGADGIACRRRDWGMLRSHVGMLRFVVGSAHREDAAFLVCSS